MDQDPKRGRRDVWDAADGEHQMNLLAFAVEIAQMATDNEQAEGEDDTVRLDGLIGRAREITGVGGEMSRAELAQILASHRRTCRACLTYGSGRRHDCQAASTLIARLQRLADQGL